MNCSHVLVSGLKDHLVMDARHLPVSKAGSKHSSGTSLTGSSAKFTFSSVQVSFVWSLSHFKSLVCEIVSMWEKNFEAATVRKKIALKFLTYI